MRASLAGFLRLFGFFVVMACGLGLAYAGNPVFFPETLSTPRSAGITDDGKIVMIATKSSVVLWDVAAKKMIKRLGTAEFPAKAPATISSTGRYVVANTSRNKVVVWDVISGSPLGAVDTLAESFGLSEDGRYLFTAVNPTGDRKNFNVDIFDVATVKLAGTAKNVRLYNIAKGVGVLGTDPNGDLVRIDVDGSTEMLVKDIAAIREKIKKAAHTDRVGFVTISDDGALLFSAYGNPPEDQIYNRLWQFVTVRSGDIQVHPQIFKLLSNDDSIEFSYYRSIGSYLYSSGYIYDWKEMDIKVKPMDNRKPNYFVAAFGNSENGRYILFATSRELMIYDTENGFHLTDIKMDISESTTSFVDDKTGAMVFGINPTGPGSRRESRFQAFDITNGKNIGNCVGPWGAMAVYDPMGSVDAVSFVKNPDIKCTGNLSMDILYLDYPKYKDNNVHYRLDRSPSAIYSRSDNDNDYISAPGRNFFPITINYHDKNNVVFSLYKKNIDINHVRPFYIEKSTYSHSLRRLIISDMGGNIDFYDIDTGKLSESISSCTVRALQEKLSALNYKVGKPDGKFGVRTRNAVLSLIKNVHKTSKVNDWLGNELDDTALLDVGCAVLELNAVADLGPIAISEDGRVLAYVKRGRLVNKSVRIVSTSDFSVVDEFALGDDYWSVTSFALNHDGSKIAVGLGSGSIRFRDTASHQDDFSLAGLGGEPTLLRFPREKGASRYFSAFIGGQTLLVDLEKQREVVRIARTEDGKMIFITPAGYFAAFDGGEKLLQVAYGNRALGIENAYDVLSRPDLVFAHIKGDDTAYDEAARKLDLASLFDNNLPPTVTKTELTPSPSKDGTFAAQAEIEVRTGGVGKVVFMVNGIAQGVVQQDGTTTGETVKVGKELQLYDGDNKVEVVAYTADGRIASNPFVVEKKAAVAAAKPRLHVAVVAVNDYDDPRNVLKYAVPDGRSISSVFRQLGSGIYGETSSYFLLDKEVNKPKLEAFFADIASKVRPSDIFVLFFAGHGVTEDGQYYFIPADFRYRNESSIATDGVSQGDLQKWLSGIVAEKSIIMFDTCESGTLTNLDLSTRGLTEANAIEKLNRAVGRNVIAAASATEAAIEGYKGHGLFTYSFMEAAANGDRNGDHLVDLTEIIQFVDNRVPQIAMQAFGQMQIPQVRMQGANFPLMNAGTPDELAAAGDFIPSRNTHVIVKETAVFADSDLSEATGETLPPGTRVGIIKTEGSAVLLSRDGNRVGFVEASGLVTLQ